MNRCIAQINRQALIANLALLRDLSGPNIIAMVKANAYGHGLVEITEILKEDERLSFGVATLDEAKIIRSLGAKNPVLLFDGGAFVGEETELFEHNISPVISNRRSLHCLLAARSKASIHLKIDTGFGRHGFRWDELLAGKHDDDLELLRHSSQIKLEGIATHLCSADLPQDMFSSVQIERFEQAINYLTAKNTKFTMIHWANSAAIMRRLSLKTSYQTTYRPGLALYGISPLFHSANLGLKPVLSIRAQILSIKSLSQGESLGYGHTYLSPSKKKIAIIAMGYGDGLRRSLSNCGYVLINEQKAPIIGTISMDSAAIDISHIETPLAEGDFVTLMSTNEMAIAANTIPWEILTSVASRIKRVVV